MGEEVTGPVQGGYYVAAYACALPEDPSRFIGYYKACLEPPASYWEADCVMKGCAPVAVHSPQLAVQVAIGKAIHDLGRVPDARHFRHFKSLILSASGRLLPASRAR